MDAGEVAEIQIGGASAMAAPLSATEAGDRVLAIVSVARSDRPFAQAERELFAYLTSQAAVSVENVDLHETVQRQAVTDELTGLFNHRRFQEVMAAEVERARRYDAEMGLIMLDIDNFKRVNDTYGHMQGDMVLREVARVLRQSAREIDEPARYGGEEMAVALPQTDLDGAYRFAERVRQRIEALELPLLDGDGILRVTASFGAASACRARHNLTRRAWWRRRMPRFTGRNGRVRTGRSRPSRLKGDGRPWDSSTTPSESISSSSASTEQIRRMSRARNRKRSAKARATSSRSPPRPRRATRAEPEPEAAAPRPVAGAAVGRRAARGRAGHPGRAARARGAGLRRGPVAGRRARRGPVRRVAAAAARPARRTCWRRPRSSSRRRPSTTACGSSRSRRATSTGISDFGGHPLRPTPIIRPSPRSPTVLKFGARGRLTRAASPPE